MSRLQGKDQDAQGVENAEKRDLDCANDPGCQPWKNVEAEAREETAPSASSETPLPEPQESDYFPSVSLAAFLALVFILVSLFLLSHDKGHVPLHDCLALRPNKACPHESSLEFLCCLFPDQPESAWQTLQLYVYEQHVGSHPGRAWILAAVELGDTRGALLCLAKATLSLLTDGRATRAHFPEQRSAWLPWMDFLENGSCGISTANIYVGRSLVPYGVMVSLQSSSDGKWLATTINLALLLNGSGEAREEL
ncbi:uncharacterized protein LOC129342254 isoform X2 [Eublepharis macularius]|uniref:Uncharacterized protein LOC129342254 isoform X2 n=1 Tax=Eublepharis macularius TaxID=481883 RepID=A0AA97KD06_EUBMA|nr:uncharacterized protein LOC129342254 isoform X2 [Eublepharis macularius]